MSNLFSEINPQEEASLSGGFVIVIPRPRLRPGRADATADAQANGRLVFTDTFTNASADKFGNSSATSGSTSAAIG